MASIKEINNDARKSMLAWLEFITEKAERERCKIIKDSGFEDTERGLKIKVKGARKYEHEYCECLELKAACDVYKELIDYLTMRINNPKGLIDE